EDAPSLLALAGGGLAALASCGLLLRRRSGLRGRRASGRGAGVLAAATGRAGGIGDLRCPLLRHPLLLELLVLLLVLDVRALVGHSASSRSIRRCAGQRGRSRCRRPRGPRPPGRGSRPGVRPPRRPAAAGPGASPSGA